MATITPFADDEASVTIEKLTIENGTDCLALYGSLDITRDKQGLAYALALQAVLDRAVKFLTTTKDLPDRLAPPPPPKTVGNPFS